MLPRAASRPASTASRAPCLWATAAISRIGVHSPVTSDAPVTTTSAAGRSASAAASLSTVDAAVSAATTTRWQPPPGKEIRVMLDVDDLAGYGTGQQVQRVVSEYDDIVRTGADETRHIVASGVVHVRCVATRARMGRLQSSDMRGHRLQRGRARRVIEIHVTRRTTLNQRNVQIGTGHRQQRQHRGSAQRDGHDTPPCSGPGHGSALAGTDRCGPCHHPGHPTAEEGCRPASRGLALALVTMGSLTGRSCATAWQTGTTRVERLGPGSSGPGQQRTPRAPARACLSLLPSGPGEVRRMGAARGADGRVYGRLGETEPGPDRRRSGARYPRRRRIRLVA